MWFFWLGVLLLVLRGFEVEPVAQWSWWLVLVPFLCALLWFEVLEPFGFVRKRDTADEFARSRRKRIEAMFQGLVRRRGS